VNSQCGGVGKTEEEVHEVGCVRCSAIMCAEYELTVIRRDGSGSIDRDEFLSIPQIASNPLASRMIAIFDEE